ncbi:MAG: hypothetical protein AB7S38_13385 [Vulcanimicrobiota bacterium]
MNFSPLQTYNQKSVLTLPGPEPTEDASCPEKTVQQSWPDRGSAITTIEKIGKMTEKASRAVHEGIAGDDRDRWKNQVSVSLDILYNQKGFKTKGSSYLDRAGDLIADILAKGTSSRTLNAMILAMPANPDQVLLNLEDILSASPIVEPRF